MRFRLVVTVLAWLLSVGLATAADSDKPLELSPSEKLLLDQINAVRKEQQLKPLMVQPVLMKLARDHAANMARQDKLDHTLDGKNGPQRMQDSGYPGEYGGQLLAVAVEINEVVKAWLARKEQRARLLGDANELGIGLTRDARGDYWYCLVLGHNATADPLADVKLFQETTATILTLTNERRKQAGLVQLTLSERLTEIGRGHSANMAKQQKMEHVLDGKAAKDRVLASGYDYADVGENLARTDGDTPETIFKLWMESAEHRKQILNPDFREMGLGLVRDDKGRIWFTQLFGTERKKKP